MWAFMPKYQLLPCLDCFFSESRSTEMFLVEIGAETNVAFRPFCLQDVVDQPQHVGGQVAALQQVAKSQDGALIGQPVGARVQSGELAVQRHVVQPVFDRGRCDSRIATSADHGTMRSISSRSTGLGVFVVDRNSPRLACFMAPSRSATTARPHANCAPVLQTFPRGPG